MATRTGRLIPFTVLGAAALVVAVSSWGLYTSGASRKSREREATLAEARESGPAALEASLTVDALAVQRASATEILELSGVLEAVRTTWVASETAGRIVEVPAAEHAPVSAGDVLVRLDAALSEAEVIRAESAHGLAEAELARQQRLGKRSVASEAELDRAIAQERNSWAALLEARTRLGHSRIRAPFDGVVNSLDLDPGAFVQPGTRIAEVLDVSTVEVTVPVNDRQVGAIHPGQIARVRIDALGNDLVEGRIVRVGRAPGADTQRYPLVVALANEDATLLPGMLAFVELEVGRAVSMRVPARAVIREFELDYVFTLEVRPGSREALVRRRRVRTRPVPFRPDWVEIVKGLDDGARVAVSSLVQLREGLAVRLGDVEGPGS